jgi:antitoxin MazE
MRTRIIKIGNSQGVRIPRALLEQSGLSTEVELEVQDTQIVIRSAERPRQGWEEAFCVMAEHQDDRLLDPDLTGQTPWDEGEWQCSVSRSIW